MKTREPTPSESRFFREECMPGRFGKRIEIVWLAIHGWSAARIARDVGVSITTVRKWVRYFNDAQSGALDLAPFGWGGFEHHSIKVRRALDGLKNAAAYRIDLNHPTSRRERRKLIVFFSINDYPVSDIAKRVGVSPATVRKWIRRVNTLPDTADAMLLEHELGDRSGRGRRRTYPTEQRETILAIRSTSPRDLGLAFDAWSYRRLASYIAQTNGIAISHTRLRDILIEANARL